MKGQTVLGVWVDEVADWHVDYHAEGAPDPEDLVPEVESDHG